MKRIILTLLFCGYYFFMPFVMVNCSSTDNPYALDEGAMASTTLDTCLSMDYTVAECVEVLQQEEERIQEEKEAVLNAEAAIGDFQACQQEFTTPSTATEEIDATATTATEEVIDCPTIVQALGQANVICALLEDSAKYVGCDNVEEAFSNAQTACSEQGTSLDQTFCETLATE